MFAAKLFSDPDDTHQLNYEKQNGKKNQGKFCLTVFRYFSQTREYAISYNTFEE